MQRVTMVRYTTKPEARDENARLSHAVFGELRAAAPEKIAYATFRDGDEWVHLMVNLAGDSADALVTLPAFTAYTADIGERCAVPPQPTRLSVELLDSYGFV